MFDQKRSASGQFETQHGCSCTGTNHPLYQKWLAMRARCNNPKHRAFKRYGGRGIKVCPECDSFEVLLTDMTPGWEPHLTLERKDNTKGYNKENCRWATRKEQARNRGNSKLLALDGQIKTVAQWAEEMGFGWHVIKSRLNRGWGIREAITTPLKS